MSLAELPGYGPSRSVKTLVLGRQRLGNARRLADEEREARSGWMARARRRWPTWSPDGYEDASQCHLGSRNRA